MRASIVLLHKNGFTFAADWPLALDRWEHVTKQVLFVNLSVRRIDALGLQRFFGSIAATSHCLALFGKRPDVDLAVEQNLSFLIKRENIKYERLDNLAGLHSRNI